MRNSTKILASVTLVLFLAGCANLGGDAIMQTAAGDPAGSANIGTGSVTVNSMVPPEAAAAGIGLGP